MGSIPAPGDDPAAFLSDVRMQAEDHHLVPAADVLPLVAFTEAVLKKATEFERDAAAARKRARDHVARGDGYAAAFAEGAEGTAEALKGCARSFRETIARALAGEEAGDG